MAVLYSKVNIRGKVSESQMFPVHSVMVDFQVRNGRDPLLVAKSLTGDSLDFGMSAHDLRVIGGLLIVISLLAGIRPLVILSQIRSIPHYRLQQQRAQQQSDRR